MTIISGLVLFAVIWFMSLLVALPLRLQSQHEAGDVVPGTPASAPVDPKLGIKVKWVTLASVAIWLLVFAISLSGLVSVQDFDMFTRAGG
jgi:predicted secreted protein